MTVKKMARIILCNKFRLSLGTLNTFEAVSKLSDAEVTAEFNKIKDAEMAQIYKFRTSLNAKESELTAG